MRELGVRNESTTDGTRSEPWPVILARVRTARAEADDDALRQALGGVEALAAFIAEGPLASGLFGWTSMFDLCVQQTDAAPRSGPYLCVSPLASATVELRYHDTAIRARQWHREVPPEAVIPMFENFLRQLCWAPRRSTAQGTWSDQGSNA